MGPNCCAEAEDIVLRPLYVSSLSSLCGRFFLTSHRLDDGLCVPAIFNMCRLSSTVLLMSRAIAEVGLVVLLGLQVATFSSQFSCLPGWDFAFPACLSLSGNRFSSAVSIGPRRCAQPIALLLFHQWPVFGTSCHHRRYPRALRLCRFHTLYFRFSFCRSRALRRRVRSSYTSKSAFYSSALSRIIRGLFRVFSTSICNRPFFFVLPRLFRGLWRGLGCV